MSKKPIRQERMRDVISYRLTDAQRAFLEDISEQERIGLGEAARIILDEAMKKQRNLGMKMIDARCSSTRRAQTDDANRNSNGQDVLQYH